MLFPYIEGTINVRLNIIEIFQKYRLSSWHPRIQTCRIFLGFEPLWRGVILIIHRYLNCLSKLKSLEMQSIFKLLYMLQVNLDVFLQKKIKWSRLFMFPNKFCDGKIRPATDFLKIAAVSYVQPLLISANTISTISNYFWKAVLRAVLTYFQKFGKEYVTTEASNWPIHKQSWS